MVQDWNVVRDDAQGYLYAYYNNNWVSYEDVSTITAKVQPYSVWQFEPLERTTLVKDC
jgi:hypothetical protein